MASFLDAFRGATQRGVEPWFKPIRRYDPSRGGFQGTEEESRKLGRYGGFRLPQPRSGFAGAGSGFLATFMKIADYLGAIDAGKKMFRTMGKSAREKRRDLELSKSAIPIDIGTEAGSTGREEEEEEKKRTRGSGIGAGRGASVSTPPPVKFPDRPKKEGRPGQRMWFNPTTGKFEPLTDDGDAKKPKKPEPEPETPTPVYQPGEVTPSPERPVAKVSYPEGGPYGEKPTTLKDAVLSTVPPPVDAQQEIFRQQAETAAAQPVGERIPGTTPAPTVQPVAPANLQQAISEAAKVPGGSVPLSTTPSPESTVIPPGMYKDPVTGKLKKKTWASQNTWGGGGDWASENTWTGD